LNHHLVLATRWRRGVFDSASSKGLSDYWLKVADKHGFAIDQLSMLPDHIHMLIRIVPKKSIEECALQLMNNGQYFMGKHFSSSLIDSGVDQLWQSSAYVGTCGNVTTALVKSFLAQQD
jgi:putative transposase